MRRNSSQSDTYFPMCTPSATLVQTLENYHVLCCVFCPHKRYFMLQLESVSNTVHAIYQNLGGLTTKQNRLLYNKQKLTLTSEGS